MKITTTINRRNDMKFNKWTLGLAALGVVSLASVVQAEEKANPVLTALSSTTISGYVDTSVIWKIGRGNTLVGRAYDGADKQDGINLNVVGLTIERPMDETEWAAAYKVDLLFGPDADAYGTHQNVFGFDNDNFAIKQAYVALRAPLGNGLNFKIGAYDNPLKYESFESYKNPNYSRSYGYQISPDALTGVEASYRFTDWVSVFGGVADSTGNIINLRGSRAGVVPENEKTYYGGLTLTATSDMGFLEGSTLTAGAYDGLPQWGAATTRDTTGIFVGGTMNTPLKGLAVGGAWDYRLQRDWTSGHTVEYAVAGYLVYSGIEKLKLAVRGDYYNSGPAMWYVVTDTDGAGNELVAVTATVDYQLWQNVITRLEFRWDHDLTGQQNGNGPFGNDDNNAYSLALNVVYRF
ncbi:MAG: porin [Verrucomicrobiae bacterium]|nr:porin [Verrucomicrobiae bacterium]